MSETTKGKDSEFLQWIHDRLVHVHGENENYDYMWRLRGIIASATKDEQAEIAARVGHVIRYKCGHTERALIGSVVGWDCDACRANEPRKTVFDMTDTERRQLAEEIANEIIARVKGVSDESNSKR